MTQTVAAWESEIWVHLDLLQVLPLSSTLNCPSLLYLNPVNKAVCTKNNMHFGMNHAVICLKPKTLVPAFYEI